MSGPRAAARLPWSPLEGRYESMLQLARLSGLNVTSLHRWRRDGLTFDAADRLAIAVGDHVDILWPDARPPVEPMYGDCGSRASAVKHIRHGEAESQRDLWNVCVPCAAAVAEYDREQHRKRMADPERADRERARNRERMRRKRMRDRERRHHRDGMVTA